MVDLIFPFARGQAPCLVVQFSWVLHEAMAMMKSHFLPEIFFQEQNPIFLPNNSGGFDPVVWTKLQEAFQEVVLKLLLLNKAAFVEFPFNTYDVIFMILQGNGHDTKRRTDVGLCRSKKHVGNGDQNNRIGILTNIKRQHVTPERIAQRRRPEVVGSVQKRQHWKKTLGVYF